MPLHNLVKKSSCFALALATIASPIAVTKVLAGSSLSAADVELAQASPAPASPAPASPTPSPSPSPSPAAPTRSPSPSPAPASQGGYTPAPASQAAPRDVAPAASVAISERADLIGVCRQTNQAVEVFTNTALSPVNRVGTFGPGTQVKLTGVVGAGRAQVYYPTTWPPSGTIQVVGWVNAAYLTTCGGLPITQKACYQVNIAGLAVRADASSTSTYRGALAAGTVVNATTNPPTERTSPNAAPDYGRIWAQINYQGSPAWIARTGTYGTGANATRLPDGQCPQ
ncbi:MAG TPA: hypothetical protein V6C65_34860 [Allocoleopsis sp.]